MTTEKFDPDYLRVIERLYQDGFICQVQQLKGYTVYSIVKTDTQQVYATADTAVAAWYIFLGWT